VEGVVVARVVEANVTALDFRFEQLAHDGFRLVSYGLAAPRICYLTTLLTPLRLIVLSLD